AVRSDVTYAFLIGHIVLRFGRALWLGDPLSIPLHQLQNGALVLFAFFMISDPKTTPDTRLGRLLFAGLVALGAWYVQFVWYGSNALLWSLACCSLIVPFLDWLLPGPRYAWPHGSRGGSVTRRSEVVGGHRDAYETPVVERARGRRAQRAGGRDGGGSGGRRDPQADA